MSPDHARPRPPVKIRLDRLTSSSVRLDGISEEDLRALLSFNPAVKLEPRTDPAPDDQLALLTDRERDILSLIASGMGNSDVADSMYLSINTVKTYIRGMYQKIGVDSRTQGSVGRSTTASAHDPSRR